MHTELLDIYNRLKSQQHLQFKYEMIEALHQVELLWQTILVHHHEN